MTTIPAPVFHTAPTIYNGHTIKRCEHRGWLPVQDEEDDLFPRGPACGEPATHVRCDPVGQVVCEKHKCRCDRKIPERSETKSEALSPVVDICLLIRIYSACLREEGGMSSEALRDAAESSEKEHAEVLSLLIDFGLVARTPGGKLSWRGVAK